VELVKLTTIKILKDFWTPRRS